MKAIQTEITNLKVPANIRMSKSILFILLVTLALAKLEKTNDSKKMETSMKMSNENAGSGSDDEMQNKMEDMDLMVIMSNCNESFRIEKSYLDALNESGSFPDETNKNPKCFLRCVLENSGVSSEDGQIDPFRAAEVWSVERAGEDLTNIQEMAKACVDRKESCKCERAYQFMKCFMEMEITNSEISKKQKSDHKH